MKKKSEYTHRHIFLDNDVDLKLRLCMEKRNMKAAKHYIEQLIVEDFNRLQSGSTGTDLTPIMNRLNVIGSHITSSLQYSVLTKKILGRLFILLLSQEHLSPDAKQSKSDALKNFEKIIEAASKEFSESFGG